MNRVRSLRKRPDGPSSAAPPSPPKTTTFYAFGDGSGEDLSQLSPSFSVSRSELFNMPFERNDSVCTASSLARDRRSIAATPTSTSPIPSLSEFGHKLSMTTSYQRPMNRASPTKRHPPTNSLTMSAMGPPSNTERVTRMPAPPTLSRTPSKRKQSLEKLPISPSAARSKLSLNLKDGTHSRRTSFIPGASGLGARTISPTDATRLARRLSQPAPANGHTIIVSEDEPLPTLTASAFEKKVLAPMNMARLSTLKVQSTASRTPSPSPPSNRDSLRDSGIGSSASGTISSSHPSPNTVYLEATNKSSKRKSLVVVGGQNGVPPVPPIPKELSEKSLSAKVVPLKMSPKSNGNSPRGSPKPSPRYKSPPPPRPSQSVPKTPPISSLKGRDRGLTLSTSIPAYVSSKASLTARDSSSRTMALPRQSLEPLNLPPLKVPTLATPTVQKVNALVAKTSTSGTTTPPARTVTTPQTAVATRFPRKPGSPTTPSLTPPILHSSGIKTASAASVRRSIPSPASLAPPSRKNSLREKHTSNSSGLGPPVSKLPAHEEEKESPKSSVWRSVSRTTGKLVRRGSVKDQKPPVATPKKKDDKADAAAMPPPSSVPKRNILALSKKPSISGKETVPASMSRQNSSRSSTATAPPPRYSPTVSEPYPDDEVLGGNSREMEMIIRSASSKYRCKIERDLEELENVRRRVIEMGETGIKEPVTPSQAIRLWGRSMSTFEKGEVIDFPNVWFCSDGSVDKTGRGDTTMSASKTPENATSIGGGVANFGFDDDIGNYVIVQGDHLAYRYEILGILGKGSFGQVCKCLDHKTGKVVAVKIIRNKQRFHAQALVEVNILQKLCQWVCASP